MPIFTASDPPTRLCIGLGPIIAPNLPTQFLSERPLSGLTLLAVEDSRFACDALRLLAQRAGARLRRAETIAAAQAHLKVYRPDVVIVDLGLPDGRGEGLIRALVLSPQRPKVILGTSGDPEGAGSALAAGADGFLEKPIESLSALCSALRQHLPDYAIAPGLSDDRVLADPLAFHDDLAHAAAALGHNPDPAEQRHVAAFVRGIARLAHDNSLETAAIAAHGQGQGIHALRRLVHQRLAGAKVAFGPPNCCEISASTPDLPPPAPSG